MLLSRVFRRERRAVFILGAMWKALVRGWRMGLCGWRHGNLFPMTQSAQSHRQMRSIPLCPKAVFYVFVFLIPLTIRQQCIIYPQYFSSEPKEFIKVVVTTGKWFALLQQSRGDALKCTFRKQFFEIHNGTTGFACEGNPLQA